MRRLYVLKLLIDALQKSQGLSNQIPVVVVSALAAIYLIHMADAILYWGLNRSYLDYIYRYKLQNTIALKFQRKLSGLDIAHYENPKIQDLIIKTRDTMLWRVPDFLRTFSELLRDVIAFLAAFIVLMPFGWWIPLVISGLGLPRLYLQAKYGAIQWSIWDSGAPQAKKLWYLNYLLQDQMSVREMRISQSSEALLKKFKETQDYLFGLNKKALDKYLRVLTFPPLAETAVIFLMAYFFLPSVTSGILTIGSFTLFISLLEQLGRTSSGASARLGQLYEDNLYVNHLFDLLAVPALIKEPARPVIFNKIEPPKIEFRDVSFGYPGGTKVLDKISFTIYPGESAAFVGPNGAGKTTIIKLLCRFYDVTEGEILINGVNLKKLSLPHWYKFLGTLFQDFIRYHFTVRENIIMGAPKRVDEKVMKAAAARSGAAEFIEELPQKYDQILGKEFDDGIELSGGQWQKLAIARAFYEAPPVLILDEPTSAIDAEAEFEIFNNLEKQYKNKTLILISHRFSTVRNADKIFVIDHGQVVESGSHTELMRLNNRYATLFTTQAKGYL